LTALARNNEISIQSVFFAACAKVYGGFGQGASGGEDVVLGIYMANRSHLDNLSALRAPTLNLMPLAIRDVGSRSSLDVAKQIHQDLQDIGTAINSAVALWEIEQWTGVTVDCFVNFLKLPDTEVSVESNAGIKISNANSARLGERAEVISRSEADSFRLPEPLQSLPEMSAYKHSADIEATVRDGALDMGLFCPEALLRLAAAEEVLTAMRRTLIEVASEEDAI
ncbi:hypothetical protein LTR95_013945, partial [Oleoguttula sp. CCFEE 5521]